MPFCMSRGPRKLTEKNAPNRKNAERFRRHKSAVADSRAESTEPYACFRLAARRPTIDG
jgi:hypothetical protein